MKNMGVEAIARVCHEANRAYCVGIGDNTQPRWEVAPEWQWASAINGVAFHLGYLREGKDPDPSASHTNWWNEKKDAGWVYGPVKDPDKKEHPCCVPYDQLPIEQRAKDALFGAIVKALYQANMAG